MQHLIQMELEFATVECDYRIHPEAIDRLKKAAMAAVDTRIRFNTEVPAFGMPVLVKTKDMSVPSVVERQEGSDTLDVYLWDSYYGLTRNMEDVEWWMPLPGFNYQGKLPECHELTHEELLIQLKELANPDCRDCDGSGIFYGNVCVCHCVNQSKHQPASTDSKIQN